MTLEETNSSVLVEFEVREVADPGNVANFKFGHTSPELSVRLKTRSDRIDRLLLEPRRMLRWRPQARPKRSWNRSCRSATRIIISWDFPTSRYLLPELLADVQSGHNVESTVFVECTAFYRASGPDELRFVGETEFVNGAAAMAASGRDDGPVTKTA